MKITSFKATRIDVAKDGTQTIVYEDREVVAKKRVRKPKGKVVPSPKRRKSA